MKTPKKQFIIRKALLQELTYFIEFAAKEQWEVGINDDQLLRVADPNGCFVGVIDNEVIGIISAIAYENGMGHISYFIVSPEHRGHGYGQKLFKYAKLYLESNNIGLDAQKFLIRYYKSEGFKEYFSLIHYKYKLTYKEPHDNILDLKHLPIQKVIEFQTKVSPLVRPKVIKAYYQQTCYKAIGYVEQGVLKGYCGLKKCINSYKVAPLYAQNQNIAMKLLKNLGIHLQEKQEVLIAAQSNNPAAVRMFESLGMEKEYQEVRMYTNGMPSIQYDKVFATFSTDLG